MSHEAELVALVLARNLRCGALSPDATRALAHELATVLVASSDREGRETFLSTVGCIATSRSPAGSTP